MRRAVDAIAVADLSFGYPAACGIAWLSCCKRMSGVLSRVYDENARRKSARELFVEMPLCRFVRYEHYLFIRFFYFRYGINGVLIVLTRIVLEKFFESVRVLYAHSNSARCLTGMMMPYFPVIDDLLFSILPP